MVASSLPSPINPKLFQHEGHEGNHEGNQERNNPDKKERGRMIDIRDPKSVL
jgi:hypothetical protein